MDLNSYSLSQGHLTTTAITGQPDTSFSSIADGTRTVTEVDEFGNLVSQATQDYQNGSAGTTISSETVTDTETSFGRPTAIGTLDGQTVHYAYGCCAVTQFTDKDGVQTTYGYDELKRVISVAKAGVTMTYTYDANGNVLTEARDNVTLQTYTYDTAGRMLSAHNAVNVYTTYGNPLTSDNHTLRSVATTLGDPMQSDDSARNLWRYSQAEDYYPDGRLYRVTGARVHGVQYDYGTYDNGTTVTETKLNADSTTTNEWIRTYTNRLGQREKVEYPGNAVVQYSYNEKGQLVSEKDPDNVTKLYAYNGKGELTTVAIDADGNGQINTGGTDRITQITRDVAGDHGTNVVRVTTQVYPDNNSTPYTASVQETSTDGLKSWSTVNGQTTAAETVYDPTNHARTVTVTNPDNTTTEARYVNGRRSYTLLKDATGGQMARTDYAYDAHGRLTSAADARNGTTTYTYNWTFAF